MDEFQIVFNYSGMGDFTVHSISIVPNGNQQKRIATEIIAAVLLVNIALVIFDKSREEKRTVLALAGITVLVSLRW